MSSADIISKIFSINGFYYVAFNTSGFVHYSEILMFALDEREFGY